MQRQSEPLTRLLGHEGFPERAGDHDVVALFAHGLDHLVGDVLGDVLVDHEFGAGGYGDDVLAELAAVERRRDHVALEGYALIIVRQFISYLNRFFLFISQRTFRCRPGGLLYAVKLSFIAIMYKIDYILFAIYGKISILSI